MELELLLGKNCWHHIYRLLIVNSIHTLLKASDPKKTPCPRPNSEIECPQYLHENHTLFSGTHPSRPNNGVFPLHSGVNQTS